MALPRLVVLHPNDGCLTMARALARRGVETHVLPAPDYRWVLRSRAVTGRVLPDVRRHPESWLAELNGIGDAVVLSGSDAATEFLTEHRADLAPGLRTFESADRVHVDLMDKQLLYRTAELAGVRAPWMRHVATRADLDRHLDQLTYPCVLKPTLGHLAKELVGVGTVRIDGRAQLLEHAVRLLDLGVALLVTELVPGPETALEGSVAVRDRHGAYRLEYGRRKLRQWPLDYGVASLMESADVPETLKINRRLLDHTGYVGISACETKRHADTGELYLIEINVRVPGSFGLSQACGVDGPWRLYATLADLPLEPQPAQIDGRKVMLPHKEVAAVAARMRARQTTLREVGRSWRGTRDTGALALRDPLPALALLAQLARKVAGRG
ncbi:carboxylate--amine ligase [Pseudonocardia hydrocarbonoxydans]|uniref:ATP-grasp domain-containing protein n=1 Tax=Pseudonocardia hydrocarbonoxydans TaxID=76726 RepID=A0A4Y3WLU1_9PSEU|nr:ATP-grasp domain-containing protein [Pseudonocardia hydrocarbonoxydans]GEC19917.1 hypothetical protein PHY01_22000 [Pseudonocardia hydrocarbonoxydans]